MLICSFSIAKLSFSQDTEIGNWFVYFGNQKINSKFNWHNEVQYRNYNFAGDLQQLLLRTGIGYNLTVFLFLITILKKSLIVID